MALRFYKSLLSEECWKLLNYPKSPEKHWKKCNAALGYQTYAWTCHSQCVQKYTILIFYFFFFTRCNILSPSLKEQGLKLLHPHTGQEGSRLPSVLLCHAESLQHQIWEERGRSQVILLQMLSETEEHPGLWEKYLVYSELLPLKEMYHLITDDGLFHSSDW